MVDREGPMRPREKRPVRVRAEITKSHAETDADALLWTFTAATAQYVRRGCVMSGETHH
jgi:hypothetical protein